MTTNPGAVARGRALYANRGKAPSQVEAAGNIAAEAQLAAADADLEQRNLEQTAQEPLAGPRSVAAGRAMYRTAKTSN
ncbi:hypothetical protein [Pseudarthrobacter oxydans]|uniref:hypothetical protein n=1 Tax=Pseudarthrobacter oxydans TaxID=1671 RepID=UPI0038285323